MKASFKILSTFTAAIFSATSGAKADILLHEDFEDNTRHYAVSTPEFHDGTSDYFTITPLNGAAAPSTGAFAGHGGNHYFAVEDMDDGGTKPETGTLTFTIGITGYDNITVSTLFAAGGNDGNPAYDINDGFLIRARIDAGPFQNLLAFEAVLGTDESPNINEQLRQDTDFDGVGDGSTPLDHNFLEYNDLAVSGMGDTLTLEIVITSNDGQGEFAFDDLIIEGDSLGLDTYEENNTFATAYDLSSSPGVPLSSLSGLGLQADADWFKITVPAGMQRVTIDAAFTHADGDIDISLHDSAGTSIASSTSATDNEQIDFSVQAPGTYYIQAIGANAGNTYDLVWNQQSSAPFGSWITGTFADGATVDPGQQGPANDPDGDGVDNFTEFGLDGDPTDASNNGKIFLVIADGDDSPDTSDELLLTIAVRTGATFTGTPSPTATLDGVVYTIEGSLDLATFASAVTVQSAAILPADAPAVSSGDWEYRSFSLDASNGISGKGFMRAKVTAAP